jgi:hypothetical protein
LSGPARAGVSQHLVEAHLVSVLGTCTSRAEKVETEKVVINYLGVCLLWLFLLRLLLFCLPWADDGLLLLDFLGLVGVFLNKVTDL